MTEWLTTVGAFAQGDFVPGTCQGWASRLILNIIQCYMVQLHFYLDSEATAQCYFNSFSADVDRSRHKGLSAVVDKSRHLGDECCNVQ